MLPLVVFFVALAVAITRLPEPQREDSARLPCFATGTPVPATMKAAQVEML